MCVCVSICMYVKLHVPSTCMYVCVCVCHVCHISCMYTGDSSFKIEQTFHNLHLQPVNLLDCPLVIEF